MSELNGFCHLKKRAEEAIKNKEVLQMQLNRKFESEWCNRFQCVGLHRRNRTFSKDLNPLHRIKVCVPFLHGNLLEFVNLEFQITLQEIGLDNESHTFRRTHPYEEDLKGKTFRVIHKTVSKDILYASFDDLIFLKVEIEPAKTKTREKELIRQIYEMMNEDVNQLIPIFMEYYTEVYPSEMGFSLVAEDNS